MVQYTLQPGLLEILYEREPARTRIAALDPIEVIRSRMPSSYMLLKPVQVEVQAGQEKGSITMKYVPTNSKTDTIEVKGSSVDEAERLMRSALAKALHRYYIMINSFPYVDESIVAVGKELSDLVK